MVYEQTEYKTTAIENPLLSEKHQENHDKIKEEIAKAGKH